MTQNQATPSPGDALEALRRCTVRSPKRIVFTEPEHETVLRTSAQLARDDLVHPIVVGDPARIRASAEKFGVNLTGVEVRAIRLSAVHRDAWRAEWASEGVREVEAEANLERPSVFATAMQRVGEADGVVYGPAAGPRARRGRRPRHRSVGALLVGGTRVGVALVAWTSDALVPSAVNLAETALLTAELGVRLSGQKPGITFLAPRVPVSLEWNGRHRSAREEIERRVVEAIETVRARDEEIQAAACLEQDLPDCSDSSGRLPAHVLTWPADSADARRVLEPDWTVGPVYVRFEETWGELSEGNTVTDMVQASLFAVLSTPGNSRQAPCREFLAGY